MRLPTLLALFATLTLFAADEPKKTETPSGDTPAKPVTEPAKKKSKYMATPAIPEGVSISDGVKLQDAWNKAQDDPAYLAAAGKGKAKAKGDDDKKTKAGAKEKKGSRESADEALEKAMLRAEPSLNAELIRTYLKSARQKTNDPSKGKKKE
jgi:hypothetical protein